MPLRFGARSAAPIPHDEKQYLHLVRCIVTFSWMELPRHLDDPRALRAFAHPVRQQILRRLAQEGPATSAILARELEEDRGATSFHLRQLARYGFVVVDEERSAGRRKYWRLADDELRFPTPSGDPALDDASRAAVSQLWRDSLRELAVFYGRGDPWLEDAGLSHSGLRLTQDELRAFGEEYLELVRRYVRPAEKAPAEARPVIALFAAFPNDDQSA
jgi:DNA-binding transcriptional ArsR family regulator